MTAVEELRDYIKDGIATARRKADEAGQELGVLFPLLDQAERLVRNEQNKV